MIPAHTHTHTRTHTYTHTQYTHTRILIHISNVIIDTRASACGLCSLSSLRAAERLYSRMDESARAKEEAEERESDERYRRTYEQSRRERQQQYSYQQQQQWSWQGAFQVSLSSALFHLKFFAFLCSLRLEILLSFLLFFFFFFCWRVSLWWLHFDSTLLRDGFSAGGVLQGQRPSAKNEPK